MASTWKHQYFENNEKELHKNIFRSLEIEQYCQKTLKDYGFGVQTYTINFSKTGLYIFLSICKLKQIKLKNKKMKEFIKKEDLVTNTQQNSKIKNLTPQKKYLQMLHICKKKRVNKIKNEKTTKSDLDNLTNKMLKSLELFTQNKLDIYLTIKEISNKKIPQTLNTFNKFQKTSFFHEGTKTLTFFITQNSAKLLGNFIAAQLRIVKKQHNFFLNFLKESLKLLINQKFSKVKGIKILIKGRINNAARSQTRVIKLGKISLISASTIIDYAESTAFTTNGTIGVKVWTSSKK